MDVSDIELIRTIIRVGSLSEASRQLHQSQPTLSRRLLRLEDSLKAKLFHRSARGLTPTDIATYIDESAAPLDRHLKEIKRHVELATNLETGNVSIGVGPINEQILIPDVLTRFVQMTGDIQVTVVTEDDKTLLSMFEDSELDIVIGPFHVEPWQAKGIVTKPLIGDPIIAVARYDHPIFQHDTIDQDILHRYPWAIPKTEGSIQRQREGIVLPTPKVVADNYDLLRRISIRLDTLCGGPRAIFKNDIENRILREVDADLGIFWQSTLLVRPESLATPLVNQLVTLCEDVAEGIQGESQRPLN